MCVANFWNSALSSWTEDFRWRIACTSASEWDGANGLKDSSQDGENIEWRMVITSGDGGLGTRFSWECTLFEEVCIFQISGRIWLWFFDLSHFRNTSLASKKVWVIKLNSPFAQSNRVEHIDHVQNTRPKASYVPTHRRFLYTTRKSAAIIW